MKGIDFEGSNRTLVGVGCDDLRVWTDGKSVLSVWQLDEDELRRLVELHEAGRPAVICVEMETGQGTQPPLSVFPELHDAELCGFSEEGECPSCGCELRRREP